MKISVRRLRGFTLIELLIVIAVIGVLATAVLSAINPVEQIRKAQDASKKSDAAELLNAYERYYATFQASPWATAPSGTAMSSGDAGLVELKNKGELKEQFLQRTGLDELKGTMNTASGLFTVCFKPKSNTFIGKAKYVNGTGTLGSAAECPAGAAPNCYICLPE